LSIGARWANRGNRLCVAGLVAAIVVVFGGRGLIDLRRGRSEKKADQPAVVVTDSSPDAAIEQAPPADAERPAPQTFAPPPEPDPIYRRTFVGRDAELDTLHKAFDQAAAGHGSLAMVVGEPGIGKTSLTEQLAAYVSSNGGKTLVGHCYEEGSLSLPYLAFVEAIRTHILSLTGDDLRAQIATGAAELSRLVPEIREKLAVELPPPGDPQEERYRLLQAATDFLGRAAAAQPLTIVLEDLHDADHGTMDLLTHLARNLSGARLLVIGTYRDVEVDRNHPLSGALTGLRKVTTFKRITLRGLTQDEAHRMLEAIAGHDVPWRWAEAVHRQTEGNPLFIQEVMRYLVEEGLLTRHGGVLQREGDEPLAGKIPEGLRDVIGRRMSRLSDQCNELLSVAAVIGREFRLDVLMPIVEAERDEVYAAMEEARQAAVLTEQMAVGGSVTYRFAHAFFRQTLYEEMIAPRRIQIHQHVARTIEAVDAATREDHATEMVEHFSHSSRPDNLAKAVLYGRMAAQQAMAIFAYGEVTRLLEQTIKVQGVLDRRDEATLCDLHLELGEAYLPIDPGHALEQVAPEAFRHAEATGDNERASHACRIALESALRYSGYQIAWSQTYSDWADRADTYARASTTDRVNADTFTGFALMGRRDIPAAHVRFPRAIQLAFELDDGDALFGAGALALQFLQAPKFRDLRVQWAERLATRSRAGVRSDRLAPYLTMSAFLALDQGDRAVAERIWGELRDLGDRTGDSYSVLAGMGGRLATAVLDGDFVDAERASADIGDRMEQLGIADSPAGNFARLSLARPKIWMGRGTDAQLSQMRVGKALEGVWLANEGRAEGARNVLASELFSGIASADDESAAGILVNLLEIAVMTGDSSLAATLEPKLAALASSTSDYIPSGALTSFGRVLGAAAALLDRPDDARAYYATGLAACQKIRFRPEIAVLRYQLAELLLDSYPDERAEAVEHLDFAIDELRSMGMTLPLNKAVALKARAG
jgi:hypothetical protein